MKHVRLQNIVIYLFCRIVTKGLHWFSLYWATIRSWRIWSNPKLLGQSRYSTSFVTCHSKWWETGWMRCFRGHLIWDRHSGRLQQGSWHWCIQSRPGRRSMIEIGGGSLQEWKKQLDSSRCFFCSLETVAILKNQSFICSPVCQGLHSLLSLVFRCLLLVALLVLLFLFLFTLFLLF